MPRSSKRPKQPQVFTFPSKPQVPKVLHHWQALKELRVISGRTGISQQALIAEGLNYVLTKYREGAAAWGTAGDTGQINFVSKCFGKFTSLLSP